ncbi:MAG: helix-turn-helix domain-containing protein [Ignavibacteria bacterium]
MKPQKNLEKELAEIKNLLTEQQTMPLGVVETCLYLGISKAYLYKLTCMKQIPYYKPNGKMLYFKKTELDVWLFRNKHKSHSELKIEADNIIKERVSI